MRGLGTLGAPSRVSVVFVLIIAATMFADTWAGEVPAQAPLVDTTRGALAMEKVDALPAASLSFGAGVFRWELSGGSDELFRAPHHGDSGSILDRKQEAVSPVSWDTALDRDREAGDGFTTLLRLSPESPLLPHVALSASFNSLGNYGTDRFDNTLAIVAMKMLGGARSFQRLYLNVSWKYENQGKSDGFETPYVVIVGYDQRIGPDMMVVFDLVREFEKGEGKAGNFAEAGILYQVTPLAVVGAGVGAGVGDESLIPSLRGSLSFKYKF